MKLISQDLAREATATGFPPEALEKVFRLMGLLDALNGHPYLGPRIALKGGTAFNLFVLNVPRLSVDIDLNYIGAADREIMLAERPKIEQAVQAVCRREELMIQRMPSDHAGGKWRLTDVSATGDSGNLELDMNFMLRTPLWQPIIAECHPVGSFHASPVRILDLHELAAGKLAALLTRGAVRDIFDARLLLSMKEINTVKLRLGFVVYGGINRKDWRTVSGNDLSGDPQEMRRSLVPMLRKDLTPPIREVDSWAKKIVAECRDLLTAVLPLKTQEVEFIRRLNDQGEIAPDLLTDDERMRSIIQNHPGLKWKALNVRKHLGLSVPDDLV